MGFEYNGTKYWYDKNLQGDITAIRNASGTLVAQYVYDAWGNHRQITDGSGNDVSNNETHIANINPFRYRGYYFDVETGWYYLNARYYDPNVGRFISPDCYVSTGQGLLGHNMFAYCNNNPVNMIDNSGYWPQWLKDAANWVNNNIIQPVANFFSPSTNTIGGSFEEGPFIGSGSLTGGYSEIMLRGQGDKKVIPKSGEPSVTVGAFAKVSGGNAAGKIGVGNKDASLSLKGVGDVLTASAQAGLKYQGGLGLTAKAKAAVFSGRATVEFQLFGWQIELGVTGDAISAGAEATIGIFDGAFEAKANASLGVGGGFVFRVKPG